MIRVMVNFFLLHSIDIKDGIEIFTVCNIEYMEASEPKCVNSNYILYGVKSLSLKSLLMVTKLT